MSAPSRVTRIKARLHGAFAPEDLSVLDESHLHAGHAGALTGKGHFRVRIVAAAFAGMPLIARHRAIYAALAEEMENDIHALAIEALPPP